MNPLNFKEDHFLENDIVLLRPLEKEDFIHLKNFAIKEPTLWTYSLIGAGGSEENMQRYLKIAFDAKDKEDSYPFIVFDKRTKKYAGSTRFYDYRPNHQAIQLGYTWYGKDFWGTGLNKNCKLLMLEFAFESLGLERVEFRADNNNARSIAAMKSLGCTVEGILRSHCLAHTGRRDSIILSILKEEWFGHVKTNLQKKIQQ